MTQGARQWSGREEWMPAVTAGMVILLGLIGMIGWYAGNAVVVQWLTGAAPMQFNTAIGFVLVGLGLLFSLREKSPWARILGGGIMALSILNFMQFIFGVSLGVDEFLRRQDMLTNSLYPGRTSPAASLAFMLAGGAIMVCVQSLQRAWRVQLLWLGGGFLLMLAGIVTVGFIGGWAQIFEWNRDVGMSPPTTLGVFLISLTVLGMANRAMHFDGAEKDWAAAPGIRQSMRIATAAGFGLFLLTLLLWRGWSANEQYVLHRITEANARLARDSVVRRWETHAAQLAALARRTGLNFDVESWPTEAEVYVEHFPSIQALALTDLDTKVISLVPADAAKLLNNRNLTFEADRRNAIARARQTGQPVFSSTAMLMMGGIGVVAFVPIIDSQGNLKGYIEAIYHLDEMATRTLPVDLLQDFNLEILEQDRPIYTNCRGVALDEDRIATSEIQLAGVTWKVRIEPTLARIRETRSPIPEILLLAGLGTAILMGMTTFFAGTAHHRNEALKIAYERVQAESAERTRIAETLETTNRRLETEAVARERMTRELEMHAQLLAQVFENMADGVMVVDTQGRITQVNAATEDIFGVFDRQGDAASWANGVCLEDGLTSLPAERNATLRALRGEAVKREVLFVKNGLHPAGCYFTVGAQPLHDSRKVVTGAVLVFTDITEQRLAALMLQRQNELLEQRVSDRTQDLKRSNAELEQFAYVASHDLQEPLRVVASYLQLLERRYGERLDGDAREFIGFAVDGAQRMKVMINDLLQFSRVNRAPPVRQPVSLQETVERAKGQLQAQIADTGATVEYNGLPTVKGDAVKLVQLFQNLIGNGIKFHGEAPPKVRIEHRRIDAGWEVTVTDNGIGIDPKHAEKVFVIFKRLHGPGSYAGSGIGLSLCKKIVEQHGGRIWVESQEGAGATFHFTLPDAPGEKHDDLG